MSDKKNLDEIIGITPVEEILGAQEIGRESFILKGRISRELVEEISRAKKEPDWMRRMRLTYLEIFEKLPEPRWLEGVEELDLEDLAYYVDPGIEKSYSWDELPKDVVEAYERLGIKKAEAEFLLGLNAQLDSETVFTRTKELLKSKGVIFIPLEEAVHRYPDMIREYFMRIFPPEHKFAALHGALWSGGVFVYVPPNVRIETPVEAFFLIGRASEGNFEHTLIIADKNSYLHFIEGCAAPRLSKYSFHDGMVEIFVGEGAHVNFTTLQNWSSQVINFNNKRAIVEKDGYVEWVEGSIGSKATYVYPSAILRGENATMESYVITFARDGHIKDSGSKVIHRAPNTRSRIISKSISVGGGKTVYRGVVRILKGARNSRSYTSCDSLLLDDKSKTATYPHVQNDEPTSIIGHEARVSKLSDQMLFYLRSRGLSESEAIRLVISGFISDVLSRLPFEQASIIRGAIDLEFAKYGRVG
ncbi:MAG: Fe-S cluster assembly protein SufB [Sulfolobales archaeon]